MDAEWVQANIISSAFDNKFGKLFLFHNAKITQLIENIFDEALRFEEKIDRCMIDRNDFKSVGGCFCARHQMSNTKNPLSFHSWGIAIDCNTNDSMRKAWQPPELIAIFNKYGFEWGGKWRSWKDYMHFEIKQGEVI